MLRLGNTKSAAKDSSEPLIRLQKNGMKLTLGALSMLSLQEGSYVDVGQHEGDFWLAVTGVEEDGVKPKGKKVGKSNTFSSSAILGSLRGDRPVEDEIAYKITEETVDMFEETWYKLQLEGDERAEATGAGEPEADEDQSYAENSVHIEHDS
jgi:hypothetical protein